MAQETHTPVIHKKNRLQQAVRLLIVDPDPVNQKAVEAGLIEQGCTVEFRLSGREAIKAFQEEPFDLVLLSLSLPDMQAKDLCRQLRGLSQPGTSLAMIALVAPEERVQPAELLQWGLDDYISRPYNLGQISRIVGIYTAGVQEQQPGGKPVFLDVDNAIQVFFAGNQDDYKEMLRLFIDRLPKRGERMRRFFEQGAYEDLARECHSMKSITASLGARQLSHLAEQMENICEDGRIQSSPEIFREVVRSMESVQAEARSFLGS